MELCYILSQAIIIHAEKVNMENIKKLSFIIVLLTANLAAAEDNSKSIKRVPVVRSGGNAISISMPNNKKAEEGTDDAVSARAMLVPDFEKQDKSKKESKKVFISRSGRSNISVKVKE